MRKIVLCLCFLASIVFVSCGGGRGGGGTVLVLSNVSISFDYHGSNPKMKLNNAQLKKVAQKMADKEFVSNEYVGNRNLLMYLYKSFVGGGKITVFSRPGWQTLGVFRLNSDKQYVVFTNGEIQEKIQL